MRHAAILVAVPALALVLSDPAAAADGTPSADQPLMISNEQQAVAADGGDAAGEPVPGEPEDAATGEAGQQSEGLLPGEFSADVALVSDYIFRGITNTDHNPAIQGGITYTADVGLSYMQPYVGFWGSNVDFNDGGEATIELDVMFGLSGAVGDLKWNLGGLYYAYPGASSSQNYDYWEIPLQLSYQIDKHLSILGEYAYSPDFFAGSGNAHYLLAGARWERPIQAVTLAIEAATGHQWIEDNAAFGTSDYQDWRVAVSLTYEKITFGIAYTDTDLSRSQCFGGTNQCDPRVTFSVGASF